MPAVTISSTYGAGAAVVAPAVAGALAFVLVDRAIPSTVAERLDVPLADAVAHDERLSRDLGTAFSHGVIGLAALGLAAPVAGGGDGGDYCRQTERLIRELADRAAVIVGRAGCFILEDRRDVLHVRLDGDPELRAAQGAGIEGVPLEEARRRRDRTDAAREAYLRHFYGRRAADFRYHLAIDSTALDLDVVTDLVVRAARSRLAL